MKAEIASSQVTKINPDVNITTYTCRVNSDSEGKSFLYLSFFFLFLHFSSLIIGLLDVFNSSFYNNISGVCTAVDNLAARIYMDSQCVERRKNLLDSGILGTAGHVQVIIPFKTQSYLYYYYIININFIYYA